MWARVKFGASDQGSDDVVGTHRETPQSLPNVSGACREFAGSSPKVIGSLAGRHQEFIGRRPKDPPEDRRRLPKSLLGRETLFRDSQWLYHRWTTVVLSVDDGCTTQVGGHTAQVDSCTTATLFFEQLLVVALPVPTVVPPVPDFSGYV
ncbi:hypothetical protein BHM03_00051359 [Ensete ventricosum]|nr:hypothetical protein BHM03_00051359 [Ensete ventricosum]